MWTNCNGKYKYMMHTMDDKGMLTVYNTCTFKLTLELSYFIEVRNGKKFGQYESLSFYLTNRKKHGQRSQHTIKYIG